MEGKVMGRHSFKHNYEVETSYKGINYKKLEVPYGIYISILKFGICKLQEQRIIAVSVINIDSRETI